MSRHMWVYRPEHPKADSHGFVSVDDLGSYDPKASGRVDILTDRYMEGVAAQDGTDIGSRKKRREYMRTRGLADADDFKGMWRQAEKERDAIRRGEYGRKERREQIARAVYQKWKP